MTKLASEYRQSGKQAEALLLGRIASQSGTTWLIGPSEGDPKADRDIEACRYGYGAGVPAVCDACAAHSKGGFPNSDAYLTWIDEIVAALHTEAVLAVEADAIAHTINSDCMSAQQIADRYALLKQTLSKLERSRPGTGCIFGRWPFGLAARSKCVC